MQSLMLRPMRYDKILKNYWLNIMQLMQKQNQIISSCCVVPDSSERSILCLQYNTLMQYNEMQGFVSLSEQAFIHIHLVVKF